MAFNKNTASKNTASKNDSPRVSVDMLHNLHAVVRNVRQVADTCLTFTLRLYGIDLYNMRLVEGKKGQFITASATKGKDGKYYDNFRVYFDDAAVQAVMTAVVSAYQNNETESEV